MNSVQNFIHNYDYVQSSESLKVNI